MKKKCILRYQGILISEPLQFKSLQVDPIQCDAAAVRIEKPHDQMTDGGFADPTGTHNGGNFAGRNLKGEVEQNGFLVDALNEDAIGSERP